MNDLYFKIILIAAGMALIFFGPVDFGATIPLGLGMIAFGLGHE